MHTFHFYELIYFIFMNAYISVRLSDDVSVPSSMPEVRYHIYLPSKRLCYLPDTVATNQGRPILTCNISPINSGAFFSLCPNILSIFCLFSLPINDFIIYEAEHINVSF